MKKVLTTAAALTTIALVSAQAGTVKFEEADKDKNGKVTLKELVTAMPKITDKKFVQADANAPLKVPQSSGAIIF
jgi:Ca2+-binding EF-hand superfamily protein